MGLLGDSWDDPKTQAALNLAAGLLSGGNFGQSLGKGLAGYQQSLAADREKQMADLQMQSLKEQVAANARKSQLINGLLGGMAGESGAGAQPGGAITPAQALAATLKPESQAEDSGQLTWPPQSATAKPSQAGPTVERAALIGQPTPGARPAAAGGGVMGGMTPDKLALLKLGAGIDLADIYKLQQPNWQNSNGNWINTNDPNFKGGFQPGFSFSQDGTSAQWTVDPNGKLRVSAPEGAVDTKTAYLRAAKGVEDQFSPPNITIQDPSGRTVLATPQQARAAAYGGVDPATAGAPQPRPGGMPRGQSGYAGGDKATAVQGQVQILTAELNKARNEGRTEDVAAITRELSRLGVTPASAAPAAGQRGAPGMPGTSGIEVMSEAGKRSSLLPSEAQGEINKMWLTTSFTPVLAAGSAANEMISSIEAARTPLAGLKTGWGTEAKGYAASVLSSLGIGGKNAELFATNVQRFQNAAMGQLKTSLDAAKGPQTEGDAQRASKLFAQLGNTPAANAFILDLAQAKAERDAMRARFYNSALPIARQNGNLQEIENEWAKRMPSIMSMPSMQKYAGGGQ